MKTYEIWSEGFVTSFEAAGARFHGTSEGETFQEACENYAKKNENFARYFNPTYLTFWGCKLFDNEADARNTFF